MSIYNLPDAKTMTFECGTYRERHFSDRIDISQVQYSYNVDFNDVIVRLNLYKKHFNA